MKINFDALNHHQNQRNRQQYLMNSFSLDSLPTKQQVSTYSLLTQDTTFKANHSIRKNAEEVRNLLQFHSEEALRNEQKKEQIFFAKRKSVDVKELTDRMYNSPPCNKKYCKLLQLQQKNRQLMDLFETQKQFKNSKSFARFEQGEAKVFDRLHNYSKIMTIKRQDKAKVCNQPKNECGNRMKKAYLKNYVPFYKRLQSIISKSQERKRFLQNNPQLSFNSSQRFFAPNFYKSKYDVKSRYSKDLSKSRLGISLKGFNSSLNTSFESISSLDKSVQMVSDIQQYFFHRMECIFVNREQKRIEISEQNIRLLSSVEFKIMQSFIISLEMNPIQPQLFIDKLQAYYEKLNFRDKQQLRIHQTKLKKYSKQAINEQAADFNVQHQQKVAKISKKKIDENAKYFEKKLLYV